MYAVAGRVSASWVVNILEQIVQVITRGARLLGLERLIHLTGDVLRVTPKYSWALTHLRT